jgi:hypothetical protein
MFDFLHSSQSPQSKTLQFKQAFGVSSNLYTKPAPFPKFYITTRTLMA